jgi:hypothetical protein
MMKKWGVRRAKPAKHPDSFPLLPAIPNDPKKHPCGQFRRDGVWAGKEITVLPWEQPLNRSR